MALSEAGSDETESVVTLAPFARMEAAQWLSLLSGPQHDGDRKGCRNTVLLHGVSDAAERAHYLSLGFGDVVPEGTDIAELDARARRIIANARMLPRRREIGRLELDLMTRDAYVEGQAAGLHPREFALLWRLADTPGTAVGKRRLLREVWKLSHVPETNSLAVHIFRLRAKLASLGLTGLIRTADDGAYALVPPPGPEAPLPHWEPPGRLSSAPTPTPSTTSS
jgi:hypothetical protein